jgi:outer membrane protein assembly factor BamA
MAERNKRRNRRTASRALALLVLAVALPALPALAADQGTGPGSGPDASQDASPDVRPPVARVEVEGHESLSSREVAGIVVPDLDLPFDEVALSAGADSLVSRLAEVGRPFARVGIEWSEADDGVSVLVTVDEGPEVRLGSVDLEGVESIALERVAAHVDLSPGDVVTADALARDIETLVREYADSGRPFATVTPASANLGEDGRLRLGISVDEGIETTFADIVVSGNDVTKPYVIERESGIKTGELYSASTIEGVRPRLERLELFRHVSEPVVAVDPATGAATVGIEVEEGTSNRISGVLGYIAVPGQDEGELTGRLDIALMNIAGTGRQATAEWVRPNPFETRISFSYREPWLLGAPIDVGLWGSQSIRDTIYTTTEGDIYVMARMGDATRVTWSVGALRYVPGAADESTSVSYRTALTTEYDTADVPANPTRGISAIGFLEYAAKEERDSGDRYTSATVKLRGATYVSTRPRQVVAFEARLESIVSTEDPIPFHELLVLGGASGLRGYPEEFIRGDQIAMGQVEYRFILGRYSRALAFVDVAWFRRSGSNPAEDIKLGYGIGLRAETRLGIIGVDYGLREGAGVLDGSLHVGLVREF